MSKTSAAVFAILAIVVTGGIIGIAVYYSMKLDRLKPTEMRLRGDVLPESYEVFIHVHFYTRITEEVNVTSPNQTWFYDGNVTVHLQCVEKTKTIFLHSSRQNVSKPVVMNRDSNKYLEVEDYILHEDQSQFLEIQLTDALEVGGNYSLFLAFSANVSNYPDGLFFSTYREGKPESEEDTSADRFVVATIMEPTSARTVFPCFDEPAMKARFNVNIIHREGTVALSNAVQEDSKQIGDGWLYTRFHPTPVMSTYLFAFTVSEFTGKKTNHLDRTIHTYARPEATEAGHTDYAVSITGKILDFYQEYSEIDYTQKLDQIALDMGGGAMENWGLVTYQERSLLFEEGVTPQLLKLNIVVLIAHELAHQWFGNLVTMKWWNELWLNEGFAIYMAILAVDHLHPSFNLKDMLIAESLHPVFDTDALGSSHPVTPPASEVQTTNEILQLFDLITYDKGAMVLRMLEDVLGERVFHKGIRIYLDSFRLKNTDRYDLWDAMQKSQSESSGRVDIPRMMDTWTNQAGYPVVTINTSSGEAYQKQFLLNDTSESDSLWVIPVRVTSASKPEWIDERNVTKPNFKSEKGEWILANVNSTGFYRVNYDLANWARLFNELETNIQNIPLLNRRQLIDDAFYLARVKQVSVPLALNSTRFLRNETDYLPWEAAMRHLDYFVKMFDRTMVYGPLQVYLRNQVTKLYNFLKNYIDNSTVPEDYNLQYNQILAIRVACSNGLPECMDMAKDKFHFWMTNGTNKIHSNLRSVIYCQAIAAGGQEEWEFAWDQFQNSNDTSEKDQLREALACTKKIWLLNRYLEYTLDPDKISLMDGSSVISYIAQNEAGQALAWNFIRANWDFLRKQYGFSLVLAVTSRFSTAFELEELEHFAKKHDLGSVVQDAIKETQKNIQWIKEHRRTVLEWFQTETS